MRKRKQVLQAYNIVVIALLVIGVVYICVRFLHPGFNEWTDNAMVHRDLTPVNARVQGFVKEIRFRNSSMSIKVIRSSFSRIPSLPSRNSRPRPANRERSRVSRLYQPV